MPSPSCCGAIEIDVVTDQTSAHDPLNGYIPAGRNPRGGGRAAGQGPGEVCRGGPGSRWPAPARRWSGSQGRSRGLRLRQQPPGRGQGRRVRRRLRVPGFVPAYLRPLFCEGKGPFRWVALSGTPPTSPPPIGLSASCSPTTPVCSGGSSLLGDRVPVPGLPRQDLLARLRGAPPGRARLQRPGSIG